MNVQKAAFCPHLHCTHTEIPTHITANRHLFDEIDWMSRIPLEIPCACICPRTCCLEDEQEWKREWTVPTPDGASFLAELPFESYKGDLVVTSKSIPELAAAISIKTVEALVVKVGDSRHGLPCTTYFTPLAMFAIVTSVPSIKHILTDAQSVDKACDNGQLLGHKIFWKIPPGIRNKSIDELVSESVALPAYEPRTITELCNLDGLFENGGRHANIRFGALNLQMVRLGDGADAVPSRPVFTPECK